MTTPQNMGFAHEVSLLIEAHELLAKLPGFVNFEHFREFNRSHNITAEKAFETATSLAAQWGGPKWKYVDAWLCYCNWSVRPPLSLNGNRPGGRVPERERMRQQGFSAIGKDRETKPW